MIWIAPSEKDTATETLERRLWEAADQFRANSGIDIQEYLEEDNRLPACRASGARLPSIPHEQEGAV